MDDLEHGGYQRHQIGNKLGLAQPPLPLKF